MMPCRLRHPLLLLFLSISFAPALSWLPIVPITRPSSSCRQQTQLANPISLSFSTHAITPHLQPRTDGSSTSSSSSNIWARGPAVALGIGGSSVRDHGRRFRGWKAGSSLLRMAGAEGEAEAAETANVRAMRASEIKKALVEMSISTSGVFEVMMLTIRQAAREI